MTSMARISGGVLAGGAGQRMGGRDKGLVPLCGKPLVAHVLSRLRPQVQEVLISANRNGAAYARLGCPVLPDDEGGGPLAGLATLLAAAQHPWLLCVPCDAPLLPADLASRLYAAAMDKLKMGSYLHDGEHAHPTFCLVATSLAASARSGAKRGQGLQAWLAQHQAEPVVTVPPVNLNTPEELAVLEQRLCAARP